MLLSAPFDETLALNVANVALAAVTVGLVLQVVGMLAYELLVRRRKPVRSRHDPSTAWAVTRLRSLANSPQVTPWRHPGECVAAGRPRHEPAPGPTPPVSSAHAAGSWASQPAESRIRTRTSTSTTRSWT